MRIAKGLASMLGLCLLGGVLVAGLMFPVAGAVGLVSNQAADTVDSVSADLVEGQVPLVTTVLDRDGQPFAYFYDQNRVLTPIAQISTTMKAAIVDIEDKRFYEHQGVDWKGTMRALLINQISGNVEQGGSTLTMQYVKNYLLYVVAKTDADRAKATEQTPARKLREVRIATQLEDKLTKDQILERYLNVVFFGNNAYGIGAAARTYFATTPDKLTVPQAALIAGMVKSTTQFDPVRHPEAALQRRNTVIDSMLGAGSISQADAEAARKTPLGVTQPLNVLTNGCVGAGANYGFFCSYVEKYLERAGLTQAQLRDGGYTIKTTMDRRSTDLAKAAAETEVPKQANGIANAMAIVAPGKDKHPVIALVANRDFGLNQGAGQTSYDLPSAVEPFGAGSIYKIFTSATALERGMGINTMLDVPPEYTSSVFKGGGESCPSAGRGERWYCVKNAGDYGGPGTQFTMRKALAESPNTAFVGLEDRIGSMQPIVDMAHRLGLRDSLEARDPETATNRPQSLAQAVTGENRASFTLGPVQSSTLDLANVSATLMSGGTYCPPSPIDSVTDRDGKPVHVNEGKCEQAVPDALANTLVNGLSDDDQYGTAVKAKPAGWNRPIMGKTGTTQDQKSAGFVGATPQLAGAVLTFSDSANPKGICKGNPPRLCANGNMYGADVAAPTWFKAMQPILAGQPVMPLPPMDPRYTDGTGGVQVPYVVGQQAPAATATLQAAGFRVVQRTRTDAAGKGTVVAQVPTGTTLPGDQVVIYVSDGKGVAPQPQPQFPFPLPGFPGGGGNGGGNNGGAGPIIPIPGGGRVFPPFPPIGNR